MEVQSINNAPSFGALYINSKAKAIIEREKGGKAAIKKYAEELVTTEWSLYVKESGKHGIFSCWTGGRDCSISPVEAPINEFMRVYSVDAAGDGEEDIVDYLKFSSAERAAEVYNRMQELGKMAYEKDPNKKRLSYFNPLGQLHRDVFSLKVLEEAEHISRDESPWKRPARVEQQAKPNVEPTVEKKPSFSQRLSNAWNALLGK